MQSERPPAAESATHKGLNDETKPERSRSAVWALLGIPTGERRNRPAPALTVPPTRSRYGQSPLPALEETEESEEEAGQDGEPFAQTSNVGPDTGDSSPRNISGQQSGPTRGLSQVRHSAAVPAVRQENVASTPAEHDARPETRPERMSIAIPGVSTRRQDFPALSHTRDMPASLTTAAQQENAPEPIQQRSHTSSHPQTSGVVAPDAELLTRLERLVTDAEATRESGAQTARESGRAAQRRASSTDTAEARPLLSSHPPAGPFAQASASGIDRANTDLAQRLEQLRRTVGELAAKISPQPARNHDETQHYQQITPRPPQRVVIIKRPAPPARTPRAFWERSHLSRLHLRTLR